MTGHLQGSQEVSKQNYVLTMDLGEKLESFRHIGIRAPGSYDSYTQDIQTELKNALQEAMPPDTTVVPVYMRDLADNVVGATSRVCEDLADPVIVSTCPEIASPSRGVDLEINRLFDSKGRSMGLGPRPGNPSVETQIIRQASKLVGRDVVVVEDGIYSGVTMQHVAKKLQERGIKVAAMVAGFKCINSKLSWLSHANYELTTTNDYGDVVDWIPDHDFLPFIPGGGKVLGAEFNGKPYPFYDQQKVSYSVPYIRPYGNTTDWASIPHDKTQAFSRRCIELTRDLFKEIVRINPDTDVTIGRIVQTRRRTSVPLALESDNFPSLDTPVINYLNEMD